MELSSKYLQNAVEQMSSLPGIGRRTALRLVLHLLKQEKSDIVDFASSFVDLVNEVKSCSTCGNLSDFDVCQICSNPSRERSKVCVVQDIRDILAIEATMQYQGLYHVLGGVISPMEGVGPADLNIQSLVERVKLGEVTEVIMALSATMEGDTTNFYVYKRLQEYEVEVSVISRGIGVGSELEYADEVTLGRSIVNRSKFQTDLTR